MISLILLRCFSLFEVFYIRIHIFFQQIFLGIIGGNNINEITQK